jgi:hypothetical protein
MTKYNKLKKGTKMPFVNVKLVKEQILIEKKRQIIEGLTDLVVTIMNIVILGTAMILCFSR